MYLCRWKYSGTGDTYRRFSSGPKVIKYISNITMKLKSPESTVSVLWSWLQNLGEVKHFLPVHLQLYSIQGSVEKMIILLPTSNHPNLTTGR